MLNKDYRKTPNKHPPPFNKCPSLHSRPYAAVFFDVFGYISAENDLIFIP